MTLVNYLDQLSALHRTIRREKDGTRIRTQMEGYRYYSIEELLLTEGTLYEDRGSLDDEDYIRIQQFFLRFGERHTWKVKECYMNAFILADMPGLNFKYIEGMAINSMLPVFHAWNTFKGKVVDLTWMHHKIYPKGDGLDDFYERERLHNRMYAPWKLIKRSESLRLDPSVEYMGIEIPPSAMIKRMIETKTYAGVLDDWQDGYPLLKDGVPREWSS